MSTVVHFQHPERAAPRGAVIAPGSNIHHLFGREDAPRKEVTARWASRHRLSPRNPDGSVLLAQSGNHVMPGIVALNSRNMGYARSFRDECQRMLGPEAHVYVKLGATGEVEVYAMPARFSLVALLRKTWGKLFD